MKKTVTPSTIAHIAKLANIPVSEKEKQSLAQAFVETLEVVDELQQLDVSSTPTTHQVTGLENSWREDEIIPEQMFSQEEALANTKKTHNGFIVVPRILEGKDA